MCRTISLSFISPANVHAKCNTSKMHIRFWCTLALLMCVNLYFQTSYALRKLHYPASRRFLLLRTNTINQRACTCPTSFSCSCCETVTLSFSKMRKALCSNFMYQRNGLNVDVSLATDTLRSLTVTNYRPFKVCSSIPGSLFSSICVNVLELNEFPRSITVCVRHEILSKSVEWQINYTCVSISTTLPMITANASLASTISTTGMPRMASNVPMMTAPPSMAPQASTMSQMTPTTVAPMMTSPPGMMPMMTSPPGMMPMMTPAPNGMGSSSSPGQMGATGGGVPSGGESGPPPPPMSTEGKRKKRFNRTKHIPNYWSKIVNEKFRNLPLEFESSIMETSTAMQRKSVTIPKTWNITVSSGESVANTEASILSDIPMDYNVRPGIPGSAVPADRASYYPSRIPPVVAMTLTRESVINSGRSEIIFRTDNNTQLAKNNTASVIFPD